LLEEDDDECVSIKTGNHLENTGDGAAPDNVDVLDASRSVLEACGGQREMLGQ